MRKLIPLVFFQSITMAVCAHNPLTDEFTGYEFHAVTNQHLQRTAIKSLYQVVEQRDLMQQMIVTPQRNNNNNQGSNNNIKLADCDHTEIVKIGICGGEVDHYTKTRLAAKEFCDQLALSDPEAYPNGLIAKFIGPASFLSDGDHHDNYRMSHGAEFECGYMEPVASDH